MDAEAEDGEPEYVEHLENKYDDDNNDHDNDHHTDIGHDDDGSGDGGKMNLFLERLLAAASQSGPFQGFSSHQDFPRFSPHKCSGFHGFQLPSQHYFLDF